MVSEQERSIQKIVPEELMRGGLIVGIEQGIQGPLMSVTGAAIERITRERTEVPPQYRLPERSLYFLDPNTRRLIMISNRENCGENKTPDKYGLFAEVVELDEEGKPHHRLSSSEIILPNDNYQLVVVGPNNYGFPPSHIQVVEEEEQGKKKFVPWNLWLGTLQNWMNQVKIDPEEELDPFLKRFRALQLDAERQARNKIRREFKGGDQGIDNKTMPINLILSGPNIDDVSLYKSSFDSGFYPVLIRIDELVQRQLDLVKAGGIETMGVENFYLLVNFFPELQDNNPAIVTVDQDSLWMISELERAKRKGDEIKALGASITDMFFELQKYNPIFSLIIIHGMGNEDNLSLYPEIGKVRQGRYFLSMPEEDGGIYRGLLNKLKADLLLTMFLRGGAPLTK